MTQADTRELREAIAEEIHYLTDDSDILSSGIRGCIDRLEAIFAHHQKQAEIEARIDEFTRFAKWEDNQLVSRQETHHKKILKYWERRLAALKSMGDEL